MTQSQSAAAETIAEGVYQVRLPLPFALNHVNCYLLRGADGWTMIDTGINIADARAIWQQAFAELKITISDIKQIVLTHVHPDHFGLAGWFQAWAQQADHILPIYTSPVEDEWATVIWRNQSGERFDRWLQRNGMAAAMAQRVAASMDDTLAMTLPHPGPMVHLQADAMIYMGERQWRILHAPGHSDGQYIFYDADDKLLLSGDHVLMKITPNIGLWTQTQGNPLQKYRHSLQMLSTLDVRLALPGHRHLIHDWGGRIRELLAHHVERLNLAQEGVQMAGNRGATPYDAALHIFPTERFTAHEWRFAIAEALAHLHDLHEAGQLIRDDGALRYYLA